MNPSDAFLLISDQLWLPRSELSYRFARSSGPGGQHVNKSETQVELLWAVGQSPSLTDEQRQRLLAALANRIDAEGVLHLVSGETRSQERNRQLVTDRLVDMVQRALRPRRKRLHTAVPAAARARRLAEKQRRGEAKRLRKPVQDEE